MDEPKLTLYDVNKTYVSKMPDRITTAELEPCKKMLRKFKKLGYFMLMCREINYYTVVRVRKAKNPDKFENLIIELLQGHGNIKDINYDESKENLECWVQPKDEQPMMFLLFPYSWGVLECE